MKIKIYISFIASAIMLMLASCDDRLNLSNPQALDVKAAFSSKGTAQSTLLGVYSSCQLLEVSGGMPQIISDFMSDNSYS